MSETESKLSGDVLLDIIRDRKVGDITALDWHDDKSINANIAREFEAAGRDWFKELDAALAENKPDGDARKERVKEKTWKKLEQVLDGSDNELALKAIGISKSLIADLNPKLDVKADVKQEITMTDNDFNREFMFHLGSLLLNKENEENGE